KDFGSEKVEIRAPEPIKPLVKPSSEKEEKLPIPAATSDQGKSIRRKRISPVKKETPAAEGIRRPEPTPVPQVTKESFGEETPVAKPEFTPVFEQPPRSQPVNEFRERPREPQREQSREQPFQREYDRGNTNYQVRRE